MKIIKYYLFIISIKFLKKVIINVAQFKIFIRRKERNLKMKKYILITMLVLAAVAISLSSCGGESASSNNNGNDTGVNGTDSGVSEGAGRSMTDGTMFDGNTSGSVDSNGNVENDVYSNDGFASDGASGGSGTAGGMLNGADMSYDSNGVTGNTTMNH